MHLYDKKNHINIFNHSVVKMTKKINKKLKSYLCVKHQTE